jgi:heme-degrading monooxygenase HmoA
MSGAVASFTVVRYRPAAAVAGAWQMIAQRPLLAREPGLRFARLLGTGAGIGFSLVPQPRVWALLAAWESRAAWERFDAASPVMRQYRARGTETYTLLLHPVQSHGQWDGTEPFSPLPPSPAFGGGAPVAVLTRATLRLRRALRFWRRVPGVDATLRGHPDLLVSFGFGEVPWVRQGTLSVWRSAAAMRGWAYGSEEHREVVRRTRDEGWYAEELFARFLVLGTRGGWGGSDPLQPVSSFFSETGSPSV